MFCNAKSVSNVAAVVALAVWGTAAAEEPKQAGNPGQMYLCAADSSSKPKTKLVYGYVNGKKTECMPEQSLREMMASADFLHVRDSLAAGGVSTDSGAAAAVLRGEKNLRGANLRMADLMGVGLDKADLSGADLTNADLRTARLKGADLRGANLAIAYCKNTDFTGANFTGATLTGAYLNGANLTGASGLTVDSLLAARTLYRTVMDSTLKVAIARKAPDKLTAPKQGWIGSGWATPEKEQLKPGERPKAED